MWTLPPAVAAYREGRGRELALKLAQQETGNPKVELTDYDLDMRCFNLRPWKCPHKHHFLLRAMQHQWGEKLMLETTVNGTRFVNYWAIRIATQVCQQNIINLLGCGSSGKTHFATASAYTIWKTLPYFTSVYLSTTTGEGADARAWATVNQLYRDDKHRFGKMINSTRTLVVEESDVNEENAKFRDLRNAIKCVLIPSGNEGRNVVGAISGRKNKRVLWYCDEYPHMDLGVMKGRTNLFTNMAGGGWAQFVGSGNGPKDGDAMFVDATPESGWDSVNKDEHWTWKTRAGVCLYFNGAKSPNMAVPPGQPAPFPGLMDWASRELILQDCWRDENSPEFYTQFFGFPPTVHIPDTVLTMPFMRAHKAFEMPEWDGSPTKSAAGLDLGFRKDGDPCVIHFGEIGKNAQGTTILAADPDGIVLNPSQSSSNSFEEQIAKKTLDLLEKNGCRDLALDVTGDGGILLQAIEKEARSRNYQLNVTPVSFSGAADDKITIPGEKRLAKDMFANKVSQLWSSARVCVGNGVIRGLAEQGKATQQLCQRKFATDEKKRFTVESKKVMKERIKRSPDQGDAFCLLVHLALKMGISGAEPDKPKPPVNPFDPARSKDRGYSMHATKRSNYSGWK